TVRGRPRAEPSRAPVRVRVAASTPRAPARESASPLHVAVRSSAWLPHAPIPLGASLLRDTNRRCRGRIRPRLTRRGRSTYFNERRGRVTENRDRIHLTSNVLLRTTFHCRV